MGASGISMSRLDTERTILHDEGGVSTSGTEIVQEQLAWLSTISGPWHLSLRDEHVALSKILGERLVDDSLDSDVGGDRILLHHHQNLDEGIDARGGFSVTNVCLDRTKMELLVWATLAIARSKGIGDTGHL